MAAGAYQFYNAFKENMGNKIIDFDIDTFKEGLVNSSYTFAATHSLLADITNELSGSGYARYTLTPTWTRSGGTVTFDTDDATYTASGGAITARRSFIYDDTPSSPADPLICSSLLDSTPADVSVADGNILTIQKNASGVFTLA